MLTTPKVNKITKQKVSAR